PLAILRRGGGSDCRPAASPTAAPDDDATERYDRGLCRPRPRGTVVGALDRDDEVRPRRVLGYGPPRGRARGRRDRALVPAACSAWRSAWAAQFCSLRTRRTTVPRSRATRSLSPASSPPRGTRWWRVAWPRAETPRSRPLTSLPPRSPSRLSSGRPCQPAAG